MYTLVCDESENRAFTVGVSFIHAVNEHQNCVYIDELDNESSGMEYSCPLLFLNLNSVSVP
jgi:hypothetical protein